MRASRGSNHPSEHSQCASKKVRTSPEAMFAPRRRARIRPVRLADRIIFTETGRCETYSSNGFFKKSAFKKK